MFFFSVSDKITPRKVHSSHYSRKQANKQNIDQFWSHGFNMHLKGMPKTQGGPPIRNIAYFTFKHIIKMNIFTSC